jgi:hypothetical protein
VKAEAVVERALRQRMIVGDLLGRVKRPEAGSADLDHDQRDDDRGAPPIERLRDGGC